MAKLPPSIPPFATPTPTSSARYEALGDAARVAGPLSARETELVKLALAAGARIRGAIHLARSARARGRRHARRATPCRGAGDHDARLPVGHGDPRGDRGRASAIVSHRPIQFPSASCGRRQLGAPGGRRQSPQRLVAVRAAARQDRRRQRQRRSPAATTSASIRLRARRRRPPQRASALDRVEPHRARARPHRRRARSRTTTRCSTRCDATASRRWSRFTTSPIRSGSPTAAAGRTATPSSASVGFARFCAREYGGEVDWWCTVNEPDVYAFRGYSEGLWPPRKPGRQRGAGR